jgi:hypothetical protein
MKNTLTNTERSWRVDKNCYGLDLLNTKQRNEVHNLKTIGYILNNVTPTGVALLTIHGANGYTNASVNKAGSVSFVHFDKA